MAALPTGTVTFLFTDIEGSTRLIEAQTDAYRDALARHDSILRRLVAEHDGVIFQPRGDGFGVAFSSPIEAVRATFQSQLALRQEPWGEAGPIRARMGLHTGEVELRDGEYFGAVLHRCARLMDSAHGGQTVLSAVTAALVSEALPSDVWLTDLGEHRLRDLVQSERIYQLCGADLPGEFPPLRTFRAVPNNLPPQTTAFIGREQQLLAVRTALLRPETRLLTLTGPGGTGKTRLGLQVASELLDGFQDGVYFVPLAPVADPDLVLSVIAQAIGVRESPGRSIMALLADLLSQKRCLLVLDNFEQVVDAAPVVAELLAASSHLKVLVTSRAVLRLYGEREYPVPPLALPDRRAAPSAAHLAQFEAVHLFLDRAQAARPAFTIDDENAADVAEICRRVDGLPLAIELAAARIRALPPRTLLQRMERSLPLLTGGARDLPARQRTLRDTIAWSYDLLDPDEQALFCRLAVFRGCTLEAAEEVCTGEPPRPGSTSVALQPLGLDVLEGIESLVEKSLLRQERTVDGHAWYLMLETVREFALERLDESGEAPIVQRRHILAAVRFAETAEGHLYGPDQAVWFARIEEEHDNARSALSWSEEYGYAEPSLRLAIALWWFWSAHGHVSEGRTRLASLLARFPLKPGARQVRAKLHASALYAAGMLASIQADHVIARDLHEEGLALRRDMEDRAGMYMALEGLGTVACFQGDYEATRRCLEEAIEIARDIGEPMYAQALNGMGNLFYELEDYPRARAYYEESISLYQAIGIPRSVGAATISLVAVAQKQGHYDEAYALSLQALTVFERAGDPRQVALAQAILGSVSLAQGHHTEAQAHLRRSIGVQQHLGEVAGVAMVLERLIGLVVARGQSETALRLAGAAGRLRELAGAPLSLNGQVDLARVLEPTRRALSDAAADRAWQEGRAYDVDRAIAAALALTESPIDTQTQADAPPRAAGAARR